MPSRALALAIDMAVQLASLFGVSLLLGMVTFVTEEAVAVAMAILLSALVVVGYPVIFETLGRGRSLGKLALGLRVVSDDGGPERFRQALFRGLAGLVEFWLCFGAPALISSLVSERGKRLGDIFSGTIVISERGPRQAPPPQMPPALAAWATTLELSRLPEGLAATARQYLSRLPQLSPQVRHEMGARIASQFAAYVSPPPPPGAPAYAYLAAVLAERRRRTEVRLARQMGAPSYGRHATTGAHLATGHTPAYGTTPPPGRPAAAPPPQGYPVPLPPPVFAPPPGTTTSTPGGFTPPA
ncbi:RDD family protein [Sphaerisporangium album]|uniref:RDD family protein n=2 Tax=Sphaerisporangium album TaxID=509200 RepID=A0A367FE78_9ACTN|nr:RDD family protein [Sphaerisporangium album]